MPFCLVPPIFYIAADGIFRLLFATHFSEAQKCGCTLILIKPMTPEIYYSEQSALLSARIKNLRKRNTAFVMGQILMFVLFGAFPVAYTVTAIGTPLLVLSAMSLLAYVAIREADGRNSSAINRLEALLTVVRREQEALQGSHSCFADGSEFADASHPFALDMDLFGRNSLFQRISRTVTTGGAHWLAASLKAEHDGTEPDFVAALGRRADAIAQLAPLAGWRTRFVAEGVHGAADTQRVEEALRAVGALPLPQWAAGKAALVAGGTCIAAFFAVVALAVWGVVPSALAVVWACAQLFAVLMVCHKPLRRVGIAVDSMQKLLPVYVRLVGYMVQLGCEEQHGVTSAELKRLAGEVADAPQYFAGMQRVTDGIDRRGNILGLVFADLFALSDFFLLRRCLRLQSRCATLMPRWLAAVSEMDALVSMATFSYNHPHAVRACITGADGVELQAVNLRHPFLGSKAVGNDFSIADGHFTIVTGANMAGKSTFLRAVGVNYILAMSGMPVFADSFRASVFALFTSMRTTDDLSRGISYFNAELLRLRQLIECCARWRHTLIILDEILKGTNSADKLNGSRLFLEYISQRPVTGIIATHDLELSRMAEECPGRFGNCCFEIELGTGVTYSYSLTPGVARNQNATFLLKEILKGAEKN